MNAIQKQLVLCAAFATAGLVVASALKPGHDLVLADLVTVLTVVAGGVLLRFRMRGTILAAVTAVLAVVLRDAAVLPAGAVLMLMLVAIGVTIVCGIAVVRHAHAA